VTRIGSGVANLFVKIHAAKMLAGCQTPEGITHTDSSMPHSPQIFHPSEESARPMLYISHCARIYAPSGNPYLGLIIFNLWFGDVLNWFSFE
jgi:hypothetical protein